MASDVRIWDGTSWVSLKGPEGPAGPTAVSTDAGQIAKLGTDGRISVQPADMDSRFVNVTGDTMTGTLAIERDNVAGIPLNMTVHADSINNAFRFVRTRGTKAAQTPLVAADYIGRLNYAGMDAGGTLRTSAFSCQVVGAPTATGIETQYNFIVTTTAGASVTPLLVTKDGISVTGNITSTGTAHNFAANSIPGSAILGLPVAATVAPLANAATAVIGVSTAYARQDHVHPLPALKADDLTDVAVTTPAVGQVLRWNGTNFVNTKLDFSDLSGTIVNPTINAPSLFRAFTLPAGQTESNKTCIVLSSPPVASATITGVQWHYSDGIGNTSIANPLPAVLGKVNTVTGVFTGGVATYSGWVALVLGPDERHAVVTSSTFAGANNYSFFARFYTATENSNWSTGVAQTAFVAQVTTIQSRFRKITANYTLFVSDADATIANVSTTATPVVITIPSNNAAALPVGTALDILDLSTTATTTLTASAGVTLNWNGTLTGGAAALAGGVAASITLPTSAGPISRVVLYKTDSDTWTVFA